VSRSESGTSRPGAAPLANVRIVLVRPRGAANVGAAARAMKNMGIGQLTLVGPVAPRVLTRAATVAVHAADVVAAARVAESLAEAVADCVLVVGTTCRGGLYRAAVESPEAIAPLVVERAAQGPAAIVFGPEDSGLSNRDLKQCQRLSSADTSEDYASLNLAQAVLLYCHEVRRAAASVPGKERESVPAPAGDTEFLFERLEAALLRIGFLNPQNPDHIMLAVRRLFGRAALEPFEVRLLLGMARQIEWYATAGAERARDAGDEAS
jgi:tRNA/rRNA methyltransferase